MDKNKQADGLHQDKSDTRPLSHSRPHPAHPPSSQRQAALIVQVRPRSNWCASKMWGVAPQQDDITSAPRMCVIHRWLQHNGRILAPESRPRCPARSVPRGMQ
eukprot:scaffold26160_cov39-Tisochrysis_lutea.AAC.3